MLNIQKIALPLTINIMLYPYVYIKTTTVWN